MRIIRSPIRSLLLLWAVVPLVSLSSLLSAQQGWAIIGTVQTSHGELPDRPIPVTLQFRGNTIATTFTDSEGKFSFSQLLANGYRVLINDEKYRPVDQQVEINPMITSPTFVRISLTPKETAARNEAAPGSNPNLANSSEYTNQIPKPALKEFQKGAKSDKDGNTDDAIKHYRKAVSLAPEFYAARNNLGSAYLGKSQFSAAQEQFESVIKINPSDAAAYFNLGNLYFLTQKYRDAARWLDEGLAKEPNNPLGHFLLGSVCSRTGKPEQAEKELRNALQLNPKMTKAHLALVNLYLKQQRSADAVSELKEFLKAAPNDAFAPKAREVLKRLESQSALNAQSH
jgi:tetratricopeptide (TPR) repeat protein